MSVMRKVEVIRAACCVAGIDGKISDIEQKIIRALAKEVGVGQVSLRAMLYRAENDPEFCDEQFQILKDDPLETIKLLLAVALSDGAFREQEKTVVKVFADRLGMDDAELQKLFGEADEYLCQESHETVSQES